VYIAFVQLPAVISIHAPARGATYDMGYTDSQGVVSIHAPARGATNERHGGTYDGEVSINAAASSEAFAFKKC